MRSESFGCDTRLMTAIRMDGVAEPYIRRRARSHLARSASSSWRPAPEVRSSPPTPPPHCGRWNWKPTSCSKATRVDGVYSDDPEKNPHAVLYQQLDYDTVREQNLRVMDSTAIAHCMERSMPILVFNYRKDGNIQRAVRGEKVGTMVGPPDRRTGVNRPDRSSGRGD